MTLQNVSPYGLGRKLREYPKVSDLSRTPIYGVKRRRADQKPFKIPLLVTGNGRSGTTWLARTMQAAGIDALHECVGSQACVSWYFFEDSDWHPYHAIHTPKGRMVHVGERRSDFDFEWVVHLVRHPLKVIGSVSRVMSMTDQWYVVYNSGGLYQQELYYDRNKSRLLKTMHMTHAIWKLVEAQADMTVRLEDVPKRWPNLMTMIGLDRKLPMPELPPKNKSRGIYKARVVTYSDLENEDARLAKTIAKLADKFGY